MEDVTALIAKSKTGDEAARSMLIENNLGLVHHIVRRFAGRGYELEDLFQIGTIGLMKAIDHFNLDLNVKFSTYAVPMIAGEIKRFLRDDGLIKVSRTIKENGTRIRYARAQLQGTLGREPSLAELVESTGLEEEDVVLAMEAGIQVESIYSAVYQEDGSEIYLVDKVVQSEGGVGSRLSDISYTGDEEKDRLLNHMLLHSLLEGLPQEERQLIIMRYFQNRTQMDIARELGVSQVQVSRLEKKILCKLRAKALE
ncbi:MAG: SigB/SigF/SigG family RNA polymerase sigma factor [Lachnospiraceae bacterium]|nr:SigB/SigF/SigG family RNA polymerase sigma factor [Lachnospiraceae bacterium]